jgi:hypothetical protein
MNDLFVGGQLRLGRHGGCQVRDGRAAVCMAPNAGRRRIELMYEKRALVE